MSAGVARDRYHGEHAETVEAFRRVNVPLGAIRSGVQARLAGVVTAALPNAGSHRRLAALTGRQMQRSPLRPLPTVRW